MRPSPKDGAAGSLVEYRGTYKCRTFEVKEWKVGNTSVRVLGVLLDMELEGDINGTVTIKRWFSPSHGLNVREDTRQTSI
jgi:hypothetical protein